VLHRKLERICHVQNNFSRDRGHRHGLLPLRSSRGRPPTGISRSEAKDLKTQSEAQYKARNKVAEAQETLNRADCKTALEGSAKRACEKTAKSAAKTQKSAAKTVHEAEEDAIKDAKK
jgi:hypothetical protein